MQLSATGRDLFLRYQGPSSNWVQCHRLWGDAEVFFKTKVTEGLNDPKNIVLVTLATEDDYKAYKGYKS